MKRQLKRYDLHTDAFQVQYRSSEYKIKDIPKILLSSNDPESSYESKNYKSTLHAGQLKLMLSELYFLLHYSKDNDTVVYAGAAVGSHIILLQELFPKINWVLIDPGKFDSRLIKLSKDEPKRFIVDNSYFTDEYATKISKTYKTDNVLFISDIRLQPIEEKVMMDMKNQETWTKIINPRHVMLKFRLPWDQKTFEYLDGKVLLQQFPPQTSTETRLIASFPYKTKVWNAKKYESQMFYHNTVYRVHYFEWSEKYENVIKNIKGLDHCYDCAASILIMEMYVNSKKNVSKYKTVLALYKAYIEKTMPKGMNLFKWYVKNNLDGLLLKISTLNERLSLLTKNFQKENEKDKMYFYKKLMPEIKKAQNVLNKLYED